MNEKPKINNQSDFLKVCKIIDDGARLNQSKNRKITFKVVSESFKSPVETLSTLPIAKLPTFAITQRYIKIR